MQISFIVPEKFDETHSDRLYKGMCSRFRFNNIDFHIVNDVLTLKYTATDNKKFVNDISNYVNGFFAAIE